MLFHNISVCFNIKIAFLLSKLCVNWMYQEDMPFLVCGFTSHIPGVGTHTGGQVPGGTSWAKDLHLQIRYQSALLHTNWPGYDQGHLGPRDPTQAWQRISEHLQFPDRLWLSPTPSHLCHVHYEGTVVCGDKARKQQRAVFGERSHIFLPRCPTKTMEEHSQDPGSFRKMLR